MPHLSVDSANFKKQLKNCVDKNQSMENWYDNFFEGALRAVKTKLSAHRVDELVERVAKDPGSFEIEMKGLCRHFMVENSLNEGKEPDLP